MEKKFKQKLTYDQRKQESTKVYTKYPGRVPIIVQKYHKCTLPDVDKCKYLVPKDMTMGQFLFVIRKRIKLEPSHALFITVNGTLVPAIQTVGEIYDSQKDEDGFLYVTYTNENTFG